MYYYWDSKPPITIIPDQTTKAGLSADHNLNLSEKHEKYVKKEDLFAKIRPAVWKYFSSEKYAVQYFSSKTWALFQEAGLSSYQDNATHLHLLLVVAGSLVFISNFSVQINVSIVVGTVSLVERSSNGTSLKWYMLIIVCNWNFYLKKLNYSI